MSCNGCTDCCKVPVVWNGFQAKYLRWYKDNGIIPVGWMPISKRVAKKRNKRVVDYAASNDVKKPAFFRCTHLKTRRCEIHSTSPSICHDYPVYMKTLGEFKGLYNSSKTEYSDNCNLVADLLKIENQEQWEVIVSDKFPRLTKINEGK